jgi:hypothetical protein
VPRYSQRSSTTVHSRTSRTQFVTTSTYLIQQLTTTRPGPASTRTCANGWDPSNQYLHRTPGDYYLAYAPDRPPSSLLLAFEAWVVGAAAAQMPK